ncbi:hypothetical protein BHE74_00032738 [Ensete ventricosum]|nr:hypothetical protein BHE74_00032738 [Ensete ventricosum]RZR81555.1 hypothetical protein BHM03_00007817 [Ensete ventricosum]
MARRVVVPPSPLLPLLLILLLSAGRGAHGRSISSPADEAPADLLVSDGVSSPSAPGSQALLISLLQRSWNSRLFAAEECEQTYGFLPCTTTVVGNMFLVVAYGFLMYKAATYLSSGSELLLEIMGPGIVGGLFLPILGALPDAMLILGAIMKLCSDEVVLSFPSGQRLAVLLSFIVATVLLVSYCLYQIYGAATMNNTLCLAVFLALVYVRELAWDFSAEVFIIFIVCVVMGLFTSFRTTFPLWTCFFAYLLYPLSLVLVYVLDFVFGWS